MMIFVGLKQYGGIAAVDPRDRGYQATVFFHVMFLPLLPIAGVAMYGGTYDDLGIFAVGTTSGSVTPLGNLLTLARAGGRPAPLAWRSILAGYLRVWCGLVALPLCIFSMLAVTDWIGHVVERKEYVGMIGTVTFACQATVGVVALALWWWSMFRLGRRPFIRSGRTPSSRRRFNRSRLNLP